MVNLILDQGAYIDIADLNSDNNIDILDIILLVNNILDS